MLAIVALVLAAAAPAKTSAPPGVPVLVENGDFESPGDAPARWTASGSARASVTEGAPPSGRRALLLEAPSGGGEGTVLSSPVHLEVGKLYRLSARVRTRGVRADPVPRYPSALGACIGMKSFPFTNCSPSLAGDGEATLDVLFFAVAAEDRVALHLGRNGRATGSAVFDDVRLERVDDVTAYAPLSQVRWAGEGFRFDDGGWIFVHVEGAPYARGRDYGELVAPELARFVEKLAVLQDKSDPERGWNGLRRVADALMLRKYDVEYLEEMKGIADGATRGGARFRGRDIDLLDVVALNSAVDLGQLDDAIRVTPHALSGRSFLRAEDEADPAAAARDRCSSFVATRSATAGGRFVMGQLFMWNGYTGVHWDVILDVVPLEGQRLVFQTFPGGIHSGSDWYLNGAGVVLGETTVGQTPFRAEGTPQSNRARKAAQYGTSIDEVARILRENGNGLYTNDWTIADAKTDEGADLLLGTAAWRLWRTGSPGHPGDTPGGLADFVWANNNTRDPAVRREYAVAADDAPTDMAFGAWNRDVAFWRFYEQYGKGRIDLETSVRLLASSPVNRPHACDGKLTTSEMAEKLMFIAHYGKTTLREKWVGSRYLADLPNAIPHLTLGYTTFSPVVLADGLKRARPAAPTETAAPPKPDLAGIEAELAFPRRLLWKGTLVPASDADNWLTSGSASYHALLRKLPEDPPRALESLREGLSDLDLRHAWLASREPLLPPLSTRSAYDRYAPYAIPRIRGTFALHQLRLALGNATFARVMAAVHERLGSSPASTDRFLAIASEVAGRDVRPVVLPWLERVDVPDPRVEVAAGRSGGAWAVRVKVTQAGTPWRYTATVALQGAKGTRYEQVRVARQEETFALRSPEKPVRVVFNAAADVPVRRDDVYTLGNMLDEFDRLTWIWGTSRQVEANRTLALLWRDVVADAFVEVLPPLVPDAEISDAELASHDLVVMGGPADNSVSARMAAAWNLPLEAGKGSFRWLGQSYVRPEDGLAVALPNPWNPTRAAYLFLANSKVELWRMVRAYQKGLPSYAVWHEAEVSSRGYLGADRLDLPVP